MAKMKRLPNDIQESKSVNISLATAVFVVIILTIIELISDIIRIYIPSFTSWLEKIIVIIILIFILRKINEDNEWINKIEGFLAKASKKKISK